MNRNGSKGNVYTGISISTPKKILIPPRQKKVHFAQDFMPLRKVRNFTPSDAADIAHSLGAGKMPELVSIIVWPVYSSL